MNGMKKTLLIGWLLFVMVFSTVFAVSLQARIEYMESLKRDAANLKEEGYYDESAEKSREVQRLALEIDKIIAVLKKWQLLERNIAVAKQINADKYSPDEFNLAVDFYKSAEQGFIDEDYEQADIDTEEGLYYIEIAIGNAREAFEKEKNNNKEGSHKLEVVQIGDREYVVRLIPERRDSLWRIAEYEFIYKDPWQWTLIYEVNKNIIDDPHLIYPGQKIVIPALPLELEID